MAKELGWPFYEGDLFHSQASIQKMSKGTSLSDEDRAPWLAALGQLVKELDQNSKSAVIACSALKHVYRETLKGTSSNVRFVYLKGSYDLILKRIKARPEHFMKAALLKSQFDTLEEPGEAVVVDIGHEPVVIVRLIRQALGL